MQLEQANVLLELEEKVIGFESFLQRERKVPGLREENTAKMKPGNVRRQSTVMTRTTTTGRPSIRGRCWPWREPR